MRGPSPCSGRGVRRAGWTPRRSRCSSGCSHSLCRSRASSRRAWTHGGLNLRPRLRACTASVIRASMSGTTFPYGLRSAPDQLTLKGIAPMRVSPERSSHGTRHYSRVWKLVNRCASKRASELTPVSGAWVSSEVLCYYPIPQRSDHHDIQRKTVAGRSAKSGRLASSAPASRRSSTSCCICSAGRWDRSRPLP